MIKKSKRFRQNECPTFAMPRQINVKCDLTDEQRRAVNQAIIEYVVPAVKRYGSEWMKYHQKEMENFTIYCTEGAESDYKKFQIALRNKMSVDYKNRQERSENALGNINNLTWLATFREIGLSAQAVQRYLHKREEIMNDLYEFGPLALYHMTFDSWDNMVYDYTPDMIKDMQEFKNFRALDMEARCYYDVKKKREDSDAE